MPSGHIDQPKIEDNRDGTVRVQYDPREEGIHELAVKYNGEHVQGKLYVLFVQHMFSKLIFNVVYRFAIQVPRRFDCVWICNRLWTGIDQWHYG